MTVTKHTDRVAVATVTTVTKLYAELHAVGAIVGSRARGKGRGARARARIPLRVHRQLTHKTDDRFIHSIATVMRALYL